MFRGSGLCKLLFVKDLDVSTALLWLLLACRVRSGMGIPRPHRSVFWVEFRPDWGAACGAARRARRCALRCGAETEKCLDSMYSESPVGVREPGFWFQGTEGRVGQKYHL